MRCNVVRKAFDWEQDLGEITNGFLLAPMKPEPGPGLIAQLQWNDDGSTGDWDHTKYLLDPAIILYDPSIIITGYYQVGDLYRREQWTITPIIKKDEGFEA